MAITFYQLLGLLDASEANNQAAAAAVWPISRISKEDNTDVPEIERARKLVKAIQDNASFKNLRVGADAHTRPLPEQPPGQVSLSAELVVSTAIDGLILTTVHGVTFKILATHASLPARCFFAHDSRGYEVIVEDLPVELKFKSGLLLPLNPDATEAVSYGSFAGTEPHQVKVSLNPNTTGGAAKISTFVRLHLTPEGDLILEPNVPLIIGPCRWMGMPVKAVYDLLPIPSPKRYQSYLEWATNDITDFPVAAPKARGAIAIRSLDYDKKSEPFKSLFERFLGPDSDGGLNIGQFELVTENLVVPVGIDSFPLPSHGRFGFRRRLMEKDQLTSPNLSDKKIDKDRLSSAYKVDDAPLRVAIYKAKEGSKSRLDLLVNYLLIETSSDASPDPAFHLDVEIIYERPNGDKVGGKLTIADDWKIILGVVFGLKKREGDLGLGSPDGDYLKLMTLFGFDLGIRSVKGGLAIRKLAEKSYDSVAETFAVVADLVVRTRGTELKAKRKGKEIQIIEMKSISGKDMTLILRDVGWWFGGFNVEGLELPEGVQIVVAKVLRLVIEELGIIEEASGTPYFSFSGGILLEIPMKHKEPSANDKKLKLALGDQKDEPAADNTLRIGLFVKRARFRMNSDERQPFFKLDGVTLLLEFPTVKLLGFGWHKEETVKDEGKEWAVKEVALGLKIELELKAFMLKIAAVFVHGTRTNVLDENDRYRYILAGFLVGQIPAGPVTLYDVQALVGYNLTPKLPKDSDDKHGMVLYQWKKNNKKALQLDDGRVLAPWTIMNHSVAVGVGAGFSFMNAGKAIRIDIFIFVYKNPTRWGILFVGSVFLFGNTEDPVGYLVVEYDSEKDKFGILIGVNLSLPQILGGKAKKLPSFLQKLFKIEGTLFLGNRPWTFAIGQLPDPDTWLSLRIEWDIFVIMKLRFGLGIEIVEGGRKGFGIIFSFSTGADWVVFNWLLYATCGFVLTYFKTGSTCLTIEAWLEMGARVTLFWIFRFAMVAKGTFKYLGTSPWTVTLTLEFRVETPWFLPDVRFQWSKEWKSDESASAFTVPLLNRLLRSATAIEPVNKRPVVLFVPPLVRGAAVDTADLYSFNEIVDAASPIQGKPLAGTEDLSGIAIVATDSQISIEFFNAMSNDAKIPGEGDAAGVQTVKDILLRYGLASIGVRRRPLFGTDGWSDLQAISGLEIQGGGAITFEPTTLKYDWSIESRADGKMAPVRLLINSNTPFTFTTSSRIEEEAVRNDKHLGCCEASDTNTPVVHELVFPELGIRVPRRQQFSGDGAWWQWLRQPTPLSANRLMAFDNTLDPAISQPTTFAAHVYLAQSGILGSVELPDPAAVATIMLGWPATYTPGYQYLLMFEGYSGTTKVAQRTFNISLSSNTIWQYTLTAPAGQPMTTLVLRQLPGTTIGTTPDTEPYDPTPSGSPAPPSGLRYIELMRITYITQAEVDRTSSNKERCRVFGGLVGRGQLFFLPNHLYEVQLKGKLWVDSKKQRREAFLTEPVYFRTKGLPGLNAVPNVGDELKPYVKSTYPARDLPVLYRQEPTCLAFTDAFCPLLPVAARIPDGKQKDSTEKLQLMEMVLNIARTNSPDAGTSPLTAPGVDWLSTSPNLATATPPVKFPRPIVVNIANMGTAQIDATTEVVYPAGGLPADVADDDVKYLVAKIASPDAFVRRIETIGEKKGCNPDRLHPAQVLLHEPIQSDGTQGPWQPLASYQATLRLKKSPYIYRDRFVTNDPDAFYYWTEKGMASAGKWTLLPDGSLRAATSITGWQYAVMGNSDWDYLQVRTTVDPKGAAAGVAVGASATGTKLDGAVLAMLQKVTGPGTGWELVLYAADNAGNHAPLASVAIPEVKEPASLVVTVFDDFVRASVQFISYDSSMPPKPSPFEQQIEARRGLLRNGRVALVAAGEAIFSRLEVEGLDLYQYRFHTSRYVSFAAHILSAYGTLPQTDPLPVARLRPSQDFGIVAAIGTDVLNAADLQAIDAATTPEERQALFNRILVTMGVPLRQRPERLCLTHVTDDANRSVLLLETPEPLTFSRDVSVLWYRTADANDMIAFKRLGNATETAFLLIPMDGTEPGLHDGVPLTASNYTLHFKLTRSRWKTDTTTANAVYEEEVDLDLKLDALGFTGAIFSADGLQIIASRFNGDISVFDAESGEELRRIEAHTGRIYDLTLSPDGVLLASAGADLAVRLWEVASGREVASIEDHQGPALRVAFDGGGTRMLTVSGSPDTAARLWDTSDPTATPLPLLATLSHGGTMSGGALSPNAGFVAIGVGAYGVLWDVSGLSPSGSTLLPPHGDPISDTGLLGNGYVLTVSRDHYLRIWDVNVTGASVAAEDAGQGALVGLAIDPAYPPGFATGSQSGTVKLWSWDLLTVTDDGLLLQHPASLVSLSYSVDGERLVTACADTVLRVWNANDGTLLKTFR